MLDRSANAPRLYIRDLETGLACCLDAYVLRSLVLASPEALRGLCRATVPTDPGEPCLPGSPLGDAI